MTQAERIKEELGEVGVMLVQHAGNMITLEIIRSEDFRPFLNLAEAAARSPNGDNMDALHKAIMALRFELSQYRVERFFSPLSGERWKVIRQEPYGSWSESAAVDSIDDGMHGAFLAAAAHVRIRQPELLNPKPIGVRYLAAVRSDGIEVYAVDHGAAS